MRVLQLTSVFGSVGGVEVYVARLNEQLIAQGHATAIVTSQYVPAEKMAYKVTHIPGFCHATPQEMRRAEPQVLEFVAQYHPDVVLSHHTGNAPLLAALGVTYPTVEFVHGFLCAGGKLFRRGDHLCEHAIGPRCLVDWYAGPCGSEKSPVAALRNYRRSLEHLDAVKKVSAVVVASDFMKQYLVKEGVPAERIFLTDLTIGIQPQKPVRPAMGKAGNILCVGRLVYNKGIQYAIKALMHLDESYRLTVAGDGHYRPALEALTAELGLTGRVTFTGFLRGEALEAAYRRASVVVAPSIWPEPAGLVVPEPRGRGLPVVVFNVGAMQEWTRRYDSVYLARHADIQSLADQIGKACRGEPAAPAAGSSMPLLPVEEILEQFVRGPVSVCAN